MTGTDLKAVLAGTQPWRVECGDSLVVLPRVPDETISSCVTDPPYGLKFMGATWDHGVPGVEFWREVLRVLKPGGYLLAFGGTRTFHRLACAVEDAGFEIRDTLCWLYGSGFPKSLDIAKAIDKAAGVEREVISERIQRVAFDEEGEGGGGWQRGTIQVTEPATPAPREWAGWGTALKPAWEPILLCRKPFLGAVAANVLKHGTGGLNIDACRIGADGEQLGGGNENLNPRPHTDGWDRPWMHDEAHAAAHSAKVRASVKKAESLGRFPANVLHDGSEEVLEAFPSTGSSSSRPRNNTAAAHNNTASMGKSADDWTSYGHDDSGSAARFFYCAKADREKGNTHPTVKPLDLMRWLVRLVTPPDGIVLDIFAGSGTTGVAAREQGFRFIGIDQEPDYVETARKRIAAANPLLDACDRATAPTKTEPSLFDALESP